MFLHLRSSLIICATQLLQTVLMYYQSAITVSGTGMYFIPANPVELLSTSSEISFMKCSMQCNLNPQCHTFDYDIQSAQCRLFEGAASTGQIMPSTSPTSKVGSLMFDASLYNAYGLSCDQCQMNRYLLCINQVCRCPPHTYWNGLICENQKYAGSSCSFPDACRGESFNLTCTPRTCPVTGLSEVCSTGINVTPFNLTMSGSIPYTLYAYNFTAVYSNALITFRIGRVIWDWYFDDISLKNSNGSELLLNGGFETGDSSSWIYCNPSVSNYTGRVVAYGRQRTGSYCWYDAAQPKPDFLAQSVLLTIGERYTFSFWLQADAGGGQILVNIFQK